MVCSPRLFPLSQRAYVHLLCFRNSALFTIETPKVSHRSERADMEDAACIYRRQKCRSLVGDVKIASRSIVAGGLYVSGVI